MSIDLQPRQLAKLLPRRKIAEKTDPSGTERPLSTPQPPRLPGRRNPKWIALGVLAICLGGLLSYVIYAKVASETAVVALAETVYRGETVTADDLTTVTISGHPGVPTVPAAELRGLVGKQARYDLVEGSILATGAISDVKVPGDDRALVGLKIIAGRAPTNHLAPGSAVRLIAIPPVNAEAGFKDGYLGKAFQAVVVDQQPGPDAASVLVNVDVARGQAAVVALLASQDRLTVVRDADR